MEPFTVRERIIEVVNKLFIYTDNRDWDLLQTEVFAPEVHLDMSSMTGAEPEDLSSGEICERWAQGFTEVDEVNHLAGNYLVTLLSLDNAAVHCYSTATHFKENASNGPTREFVGSYDLRLRHTDLGWRIYNFVYHFKYGVGNMTLD